MKNAGTQKKEDVLREKTFRFAIRMVRLYKYLTEEKKEFTLSKQILRCGTNPGAMVREAANAESGMDFIHKLGVAQKEIGETQYWLELMVETNYLTNAEFQSLYGDSKDIMNLLRSSILTKKKNLGINAVLVICLLAGILKFLVF